MQINILLILQLFFSVTIFARSLDDSLLHCEDVSFLQSYGKQPFLLHDDVPISTCTKISRHTSSRIVVKGSYEKLTGCRYQLVGYSGIHCEETQRYIEFPLTADQPVAKLNVLDKEILSFKVFGNFTDIVSVKLVFKFDHGCNSKRYAVLSKGNLIRLQDKNCFGLKFLRRNIKGTSLVVKAYSESKRVEDRVSVELFSGGECEEVTKMTENGQTKFKEVSDLNLLSNLHPNRYVRSVKFELLDDENTL